MQGSNGDIDTENRLKDMVSAVEEGEGGICGESNMQTLITIHNREPMRICYMTQRTQTGAL